MDAGDYDKYIRWNYSSDRFYVDSGSHYYAAYGAVLYNDDAITTDGLGFDDETLTNLVYPSVPEGYTRSIANITQDKNGWNFCPWNTLDQLTSEL